VRPPRGWTTAVHTHVAAKALDGIDSPLDLLEGSDVLLPQIQAPALLAGKAFDADKRVIEPLPAARKTAVIPCVPGRSRRRPYDEDLCEERHLIENSFCKLKQFRAIATRYDKRAPSTSWPASMPPLSSFYSIEDTL
jgi:hypothetical protein